MQVAELLEKEGVRVRVVSMPCWELFDEQTLEYRKSVFPKGVPVIAVEAASVEVRCSSAPRAAPTWAGEARVAVACGERPACVPMCSPDATPPPLRSCRALVRLHARFRTSAASPPAQGWSKYAHAIVGMEGFGASAPAKDLHKKFGFTVEHVAARGREVIAFYGTGDSEVPWLMNRP